MDREQMLKEFAKTLNEKGMELGYGTISEYTLNQIVMMYKKEYNPPSLPINMINDINDNIISQMDESFERMKRSLKSVFNPFYSSTS